MVNDLTGFHDILFPLTISITATGGEEAQVSIHVTSSGYEYRNAEWSELRGRWDVSSRVKTIAQSNLLTAFFKGRKGPAFSFRWQPLDNYQVLGSWTGDGDGVTEIFPLYQVQEDEIEDILKRIVLPVDETRYDTDIDFALYINEVLVDPEGIEHPYEIDFRNGRVQFLPLKTVTGDDIYAVVQETSGDDEYWFVADSSDPTDLTIFEVGDKIISTGFSVSANNNTAATAFEVLEVDVMNNSIRVDGPLLDESAGNEVTIRLLAALAVGETLTWDGEYHVPVRFGMNHLRKTMVTHEIVSYEEISIIELLPEEILETPD